MKNLAILILAILGMTSCSKDSLEPSFESLKGPEKSEIMIRVSYLTWSDNKCESSCGLGYEEVAFVANAEVSLYEGANIQSDISVSPVMNLRTNKEGSALLEDIDPGTYTVIVESELGTKSRSLTTQLNKRSYIDFSF